VWWWEEERFLMNFAGARAHAASLGRRASSGNESRWAAGAYSAAVACRTRKRVRGGVEQAVFRPQSPGRARREDAHGARRLPREAFGKRRVRAGLRDAQPSCPCQTKLLIAAAFEWRIAWEPGTALLR